MQHFRRDYQITMCKFIKSNSKGEVTNEKNCRLCVVFGDVIMH